MTFLLVIIFTLPPETPISELLSCDSALAIFDLVNCPSSAAVKLSGSDGAVAPQNFLCPASKSPNKVRSRPNNVSFLRYLRTPKNMLLRSFCVALLPRIMVYPATGGAVLKASRVIIWFSRSTTVTLPYPTQVAPLYQLTDSPSSNQSAPGSPGA